MTASASADDATGAKAMFRLGWLMAEFYHRPASQPPVAPDPAERLPGLSRLNTSNRAAIALQGITGLVTAWSTAAGTAVDEAAALKSCFYSPSRTIDEVRRAATALHISMTRALFGTSQGDGLAYQAGRALYDTTELPDADHPALFQTMFSQGRVREIQSWLNDLDNAFPSLSAAAVRDGLEQWATWISVNAEPGDEAASTRLTVALHDQGRIWRSLLSGDKAPGAFLESTDYLEAAQRLFQRIAAIAKSAMKSYWHIVFAFFVVVAGSVAVIVWALNGSTQVGAAIVALAGAFGISWKAVSSTVGRTLGHAEQPLWDAEVRAAVAKAVTRLPG
jgi:hypothetical protein